MMKQQYFSIQLSKFGNPHNRRLFKYLSKLLGRNDAITKPVSIFGLTLFNKVVDLSAYDIERYRCTATNLSSLIHINKSYDGDFYIISTMLNPNINEIAYKMGWWGEFDETLTYVDDNEFLIITQDEHLANMFTQTLNDDLYIINDTRGIIFMNSTAATNEIGKFLTNEMLKESLVEKSIGGGYHFLY